MEGGWDSLRNLMQVLLGGLPRCVKKLTFDGCVMGSAVSGQFGRGRPEWDLSYE